MNTINVPTREEVAENNQAIFDTLNKALGFVPNLYATMAHSDTALGNYLQFQNGKTSLSNKEKEVVNLIVSQVNECAYCLAAHTAIAKMNGFSEEQIIEFRKGTASFDPKLDALVKLAKVVTETRGKAEGYVVERFLDSGYTKGNLVDVITLIGDKTVMNYLHNLTDVEIDFPAIVSI